MPDIKILPEARDIQARYHRFAVDTLIHIANSKETGEVSRALAQSALDLLEAQDDSAVAAVRAEREDS